MKKIIVLFLIISQAFLLNAKVDVKTLSEAQIKEMISHKWRLITIEAKGKTIQVPADKPQVALKFGSNGVLDEYAGDKHFTGTWTYNHSKYTIVTKDSDGSENHIIVDISTDLLKMQTKFMGMKVIYIMKKMD